MPEDPATLFDSHQAHPIALLAGTNSNDGAALTALFKSPSTVAGYREYLTTRFGEFAGQALKLYPAAKDSEVPAAVDLVTTDVNFLFGARSMMDAMSRIHGKVYWYQFTYRDPISRNLGIGGSFHGAEMGYVNGDFNHALYAGPPFAKLPPVYGEGDRTLLRAMNGAWVQFAKTGNPNSRGLPHWPASDPRRPVYLEYGASIQIARPMQEKRMHFLREYYEKLRAEKAQK